MEKQYLLNTKIEYTYKLYKGYIYIKVGCFDKVKADNFMKKHGISYNVSSNVLYRMYKIIGNIAMQLIFKPSL